MTLAETIKELGLQEQVSQLFAEYRREISLIVEKHNGLFSQEEIALDSPEYEQFLQELKPHWISLTTEIRKRVRKAQKGNVK